MPIDLVLSDDHAIVRAGLCLLLETYADLRVIGEAGDGRAAVRLACRVCPDVVIMDIAMAGLNGIEATRQVRALCPSTQVIMLTMHTSAEYVAQALQAGALGYVLKDGKTEEVVAAVRAVHGGRRYLSKKIAAAYDEISAHAGISPLARLSDREREILQLMVEGQPNEDIARLLSLSPKTVKTYRTRLMHKLGISTIPALVKFAITHGVTGLM